MADEVIKEKIYCTPCGQNNDVATMAMLNNSNNWNNNPFMYLIWLAFFGGGNGFGWGNRGEMAQNADLSRQLQTLQGTVADNHNSDIALGAINGNHEALHQISAAMGVNTATMQGAIDRVQNAITTVGGQVGMTGQQVINSVLLGNKDLTAALQNCCCENKSMAYEGQIRDLQNTANINANIENTRQALVNGFANVGYATQQQTCDIINAGNANTQRIIDTMNNHWQSDLQQRYQDAKLELSQLNQNATLIAALKTT